MTTSVDARVRSSSQGKGVISLSGEQSPHALEQAPKKLIDFFDKSLLQHFAFERFLIVRTIPFER